MKKAALSVCALALSGQAMALSLDLNVSQHAVDAGVAMPLGAESGAYASVLYREDRGHMYDFGLFASGRSGNISGKVGAKVFGADLKKADGWGIAPGATLALHIMPALRVEGEYFYSPSVLSWKDLENLKQFETRVVFSPIPNADIYFGYRDVKFNTDNAGERTLHQGGFAGITFTL